MRLLFIVMLSAIVSAQTTPTLQFKGAQRPLHASVATGPADLGAKAGTKVMLFVDVTPNPNIHVYAPGAKDYIPITVKLNAAPEIKAGKVTYPKADVMTFADEKVPVFQKPFRLTQPVDLSGSLKPGTTVTINGSVDYQACDDKVCYPPESSPVTWTLTVK